MAAAISTRAAAFHEFAQREALVARRLRSVPRAASTSITDATGSSGSPGFATAIRPRSTRRASASRRGRSAIASTCSGSPTSSGRRVRRRCGVGGDLRRFSVRGQRSQRRRVGAAARVPSRRSVGMPPDAFSRDRSGLGSASAALGRDGRRRVRVAREPSPALCRALRRLSRRSPGRLLSHLRT